MLVGTEELVDLFYQLSSWFFLLVNQKNIQLFTGEFNGRCKSSWSSPDNCYLSLDHLSAFVPSLITCIRMCIPSRSGVTQERTFGTSSTTTIQSVQSPIAQNMPLGCPYHLLRLKTRMPTAISAAAIGSPSPPFSFLPSKKNSTSLRGASDPKQEDP